MFCLRTCRSIGSIGKQNMSGSFLKDLGKAHVARGAGTPQAENQAPPTDGEKQTP